MTPRSLACAGGGGPPPKPPPSPPRLSGVVVSIGDDGDDDDGDSDPSENESPRIVVVPIVTSFAITVTGAIGRSLAFALAPPIPRSRCRRPKIFTSPLLASGGGVGGNGGCATDTGTDTGTACAVTSPLAARATAITAPPTTTRSLPRVSSRPAGLADLASPLPDADRRPIALALDMTSDDDEM